MSFEEALCKDDKMITSVIHYKIIKICQTMNALKNAWNYFAVANHRIFIAGSRNLKIGLRTAIEN